MMLSGGQGGRSRTGSQENVARAGVDLLLNLQEALRRDGREVMSFWKILPDRCNSPPHLFPMNDRACKNSFHRPTTR